MWVASGRNGSVHRSLLPLLRPHPSSSFPCASENDKLPSCSGGLSASFVTLSQACSRIICNLLSRKRKQQRPGEKQRLLTHIPGGAGRGRGAQPRWRDRALDMETWTQIIKQLSQLKQRKKHQRTILTACVIAFQFLWRQEMTKHCKIL